MASLSSLHTEERMWDKDNERFNYRWVILACAMISDMLSWGILYSVGVYYVEWNNYFRATKAELAIVGGLPSGTACVSAPLCGFIIHHIGVRKSGFIGACLMVISQLASAFAPSVLYLAMVYGLISGLGTGLCGLAASVSLNQYFFEKRSLAEGVMNMGVAGGTFVFTIFSQKLIDVYGWRGALVIMSAVTLHLIVMFQLMISPTLLKKISFLRNWKSDLWLVDGATDKPKEGDEKIHRLKTYEQKSWLKRCFQLFKNPVFLLLLTSNTICWISLFVPFVHLAERSRLEGIDSDTSAWISSTMGLAGIFGRLFLSLVPDLLKVNVFYVFGASNVILGIFTVISPFFSTTVGLFVYSGLFGFLSASVPLMKSSTANLLGNEQFPLAYSWILFVEGFALYCGSPVAGWIYDTTLSYDYSFYCMGTFLIISGMLATLKNTAQRLEKKFYSKHASSFTESYSPS